MHKSMINMALRWSFAMGLVCVTSLIFAAFFRWLTPDISSIVFLFLLISIASGFIGLILILFGFLTPVVSQYIFNHMLSENRKNQMRKFSIWRFFLNLDKNQENDDTRKTDG